MVEVLHDCWSQQSKDFETRGLEDVQTVMPSVEESMDLCGSFWNDHETTATFLSKGFLESKVVLMKMLEDKVMHL